MISLSVGEPDFLTPWHIREEGITSAGKGQHAATPRTGACSALRAEISNFIERHYDVEYDPQLPRFLSPWAAARLSICALRCLVGEGDEVIIPEPCFVCYDPLTQYGGRRAGFHRNESGKRIPLDARRT